MWDRLWECFCRILIEGNRGGKQLCGTDYGNASAGILLEGNRGGKHGKVWEIK